MDFGKILTEKEAQALNALTLAYVGDAVQSLYVRHKLAIAQDGVGLGKCSSTGKIGL